MASTATIQGLRNRISEHPGPVLSAYVNVNPAHPENQGKAYVNRLKTALKECGAPEDLSKHALEFFRDEPPHARTIAYFAAPDGLFETSRLNLDLPEEIRWGEPDVAPLMLALDEYENYGVLLVDRKEFRFLVTSLGEIEEVAEARNILNTAGWRELTISPANATPRGGSSKDDFEDRVEENTRHFYREVGETVRHEVKRQGIGRLILAGPGERTAEFRKTLPNELRERVVGEVHVPVDAPESEVLEKISSARRKAESNREAELLEKAREGGVYGMTATLEALQEGRISHLLVSWQLEGEVYWSAEDGIVVLEGSPLETAYDEAQIRMRPLMDVLVDLAGSHGYRIEFVREESDAYEDLRDEFGGIAGVTRF
ncbi:MAG: VLRF1 family aeRF1-type release factor [Rubrobacteraceae bacterium]